MNWNYCCSSTANGDKSFTDTVTMASCYFPRESLRFPLRPMSAKFCGPFASLTNFPFFSFLWPAGIARNVPYLKNVMHNFFDIGRF